MDDSVDLQPSDVETLALGAGIGTAGRLVGRVLALAGQVALARILGPASLGLYAIGLTTLKVVGQFAVVGLDKSVVRFGSAHSPEDAGEVGGAVRQSLLLAFLVGSVFGLVVFSLAPWLAESLFHDPRLISVLRGFCFAIPFFACLRVAAAATTISKRTTYYVITQELLQPAVELALILAAFLLGLGLGGMVAASIVSLATALVLALRYIVRLLPHTLIAAGQPRMYRQLLIFSVPVASAGLLATLTNWGDRYLVGIFRPTAEIGIYQVASQASMLFPIILSGFGIVLTPMIADHDRAGRHAGLEQLFRVATKWALYASLPFFLVIAFLPGEIMSVVFGPGFAPAAVPMVVLALGQLFNVGTGSAGLLLVMTGRPGQWNLISIAALLVGLVLGVLLIPRFGLIGAAISTSTAVAGKFAFGLLQVRRSLGMWPYDRRYLKGLLAAIAALAPLLLVRAAPLMPSLTRLAVGGLGCAATFGLALLLLRFDPEDRQLLRALRRRVANGR